MDFEIIQSIITQIINAIQNTGVAAVRSIKETVTTHTYKVDVQNPVKEVKVEGRVKVQNQKDVEREVKQVAQAVKNLEKALAPLKSIEVKNFPKYPEFPKPLPFPKFPEHPKSVEVNNLKTVINSLESLERTFGKLKLDPKINVAAPIIPETVVKPVVNIPTPVVNVEKPDLSQIKKLVEYFESLDVKHPLAVRLSDGKAFYKAIDRLAEVVTANNPFPFMDEEGNGTRALISPNGGLKVDVVSMIGTDDKAVKVTEVGSITYVAKAEPGSSEASAVWQVKKIDETTGTVITWADGDAEFNNIATDLTALSYS